MMEELVLRLMIAAQRKLKVVVAQEILALYC